MKRTTLIPALLTGAMCLVGCSFQPSRNSSSPVTDSSNSASPLSSEQLSSEEVSSSDNLIHKLSIYQLPQIDYYQYDKLDLTDLIVYEKIYDGDTLQETKTIEDYVLTWDDTGKTVDLEERIESVGELQIDVSHGNAASVSFSISVEEPKSVSQTMSVTLPDRTQYHLGDSLDLTGLEVEIKTKKTSATGDGKYSEFLDSDDYTLEYNGHDALTYQFTEAGDYVLNLVYEGYVKTLTYDITVSFFDSTLQPETIVDNTINYVTDNQTMTVTISNPNKTNTTGGYYTPDEVNCDFNIAAYSERCATGQRFMPATGKSKMLVVPVVLKGDSSRATTKNWNTIHDAFFGESSSLYFESLHSYYKQSSYGKLDIEGCVTDYFYPYQEDNSLNVDASDYTSDQDLVMQTAEAAWEWAKDEYNLVPSDFDSNSDGCVDGIWLIYLHDVNTSGTDNFWAFSTATSGIGTHNDPAVNTFGWAGLSFLTDSQYGSAYASSYDNHSCDAHVLIHETGHMMGLWDYYSYSGADYAPLGQIDMMDHNLCDQNSYSKLLFGQTKPYVVTGNCSITINSSQLENSLIIIPYDDKTYTTLSDGTIRFNMFDEYLLIDFYTDQNLNSSDYDVYNATHISGKGARVYHVDARLSKFNTMGSALSNYTDPDDAITDSSMLFRVINNSESGDRAESNYGTAFNGYDAFDEIRLISADKQKLSTSHSASNSTLFKQGKTFSVSSYKKQFVDNKFDNGEDCSYSVSFDSIG